MMETLVFYVAWLIFATFTVVSFPLRVFLWIWDRIAPDRNKPKGW